MFYDRKNMKKHIYLHIHCYTFIYDFPIKSRHVKGWCGLGQVQFSSDFDGLDALELWFLS